MFFILFCFHPTIKMVGFPAEKHKKIIIFTKAFGFGCFFFIDKKGKLNYIYINMKHVI